MTPSVVPTASLNLHLPFFFFFSSSHPLRSSARQANRNAENAVAIAAVREAEAKQARSALPPPIPPSLPSIPPRANAHKDINDVKDCCRDLASGPAPRALSLTDARVFAEQIEDLSNTFVMTHLAKDDLALTQACFNILRLPRANFGSNTNSNVAQQNPSPPPRPGPDDDDKRAKLAQAQMDEGLPSKAMKTLLRRPGIPYDEDVRLQLLNKHPRSKKKAELEAMHLQLPPQAASTTKIKQHDLVNIVTRKAREGSSSGPSGFGYDHLLIMAQSKKGFEAFKVFYNRLVSDTLPSAVLDMLKAACLIAIPKSADPTSKAVRPQRSRSVKS